MISESENTIFRNDSFATKSVVAFLKLEANNTLHQILTPLIDEVLKNPDGYEVLFKLYLFLSQFTFVKGGSCQMQR